MLVYFDQDSIIINSNYEFILDLKKSNHKYKSDSPLVTYVILCVKRNGGNEVERNRKAKISKAEFMPISETHNATC